MFKQKLITDQNPRRRHRSPRISRMHGSGPEPAWSGASPAACPRRRLLAADRSRRAASDFTFVQISDSHIGFNKPANPDVTATLQKRHRQDQRAADVQPGLHDPHRRSHAPRQARGVRYGLASAAKAPRQQQVFYVPGEHDFTGDDGKQYLERYRQRHRGKWLVQLRPQGRALRRPDQRRCSSKAWASSATISSPGCSKDLAALISKHADRGLRAYSAVVGLSGMGLGHGG